LEFWTCKLYQTLAGKRKHKRIYNSGVAKKGVDGMSTAVSGGDSMTDYQFKSIIKMVLKIMDGKENLEDAKKEVAELIDEEAKK
jgi:hypothetical protein